MKTVPLKIAFALATVAFVPQALAQITFYEQEGFGGRALTANRPMETFQGTGFDNRAASVVVTEGRWEACEFPRYAGRCIVLRPGRYPSLDSTGFGGRISSVRDIARDARVEESRYVPMPVALAPQLTLYEQEGFRGQFFSTDRQVGNLRRSGFNDSASSAVVAGESWEVCESERFGGRCVVLRPGRYPSLAAMGLNNRISSVRDLSAAPRAVAPPPPADRIYEAPVTSVRAVVGPPEQRCWVERAEVSPDRGRASVPGAVVGALIGGILGHQVGRGTGQDIATAGGAVAGGVVGANVGRSAGAPSSQDVQRCENVSRDLQPSFWDVTYTFRGVEHRVQMSAPPGATIPVNERGEPRA
jgi:uncharacterized protein YcfJ